MQTRFQRVHIARHHDLFFPAQPAIFAHRHRPDRRQRARFVERDVKHEARIVGAKTVLLVRAGVPGASVDLEVAVPVAQREIVETRGLGASRLDGIGRIDSFLQDPAHAAVGQGNAKIVGRRRRLVEKRRGVVIGDALRERRAEERALERVELDNARCQHDMHIRRDAVQPLRTRPDAFDERCIVIAGQHDPRAGKARQRAEKAPDDGIGDSLLIEYVASHQHRVNAARGGLTGNPAHRFETRFGEMRGFLGVELAELGTDLPVRGVQESDHGVSILWMSGAACVMDHGCYRDRDSKRSRPGHFRGHFLY